MRINKRYVVMLLLLGLVACNIGCGKKKTIKPKTTDIAKESSIETEPENINNNDTKYEQY